MHAIEERCAKLEPCATKEDFECVGLFCLSFLIQVLGSILLMEMEIPLGSVGIVVTELQADATCGERCGNRY